MNSDLVLKYPELRERLSRVRLSCIEHDIEYANSLRGLSEAIGISLSCLGWFIHDTRSIQVRTYGKILKYVNKMEKQLDIEFKK